MHECDYNIHTETVKATSEKMSLSVQRDNVPITSVVPFN